MRSGTLRTWKADRRTTSTRPTARAAARPPRSSSPVIPARGPRPGPPRAAGGPSVSTAPASGGAPSGGTVLAVWDLDEESLNDHLVPVTADEDTYRALLQRPVRLRRHPLAVDQERELAPEGLHAEGVLVPAGRHRRRGRPGYDVNPLVAVPAPDTVLAFIPRLKYVIPPGLVQSVPRDGGGAAQNQAVATPLRPPHLPEGA